MEKKSALIGAIVAQDWAKERNHVALNVLRNSAPRIHFFLFKMLPGDRHATWHSAISSLESTVDSLRSVLNRAYLVGGMSGGFTLDEGRQNEDGAGRMSGWLSGFGVADALQKGGCSSAAHLL